MTEKKKERKQGHPFGIALYKPKSEEDDAFMQELIFGGDPRGTILKCLRGPLNIFMGRDSGADSVEEVKLIFVEGELVEEELVE